MESRRRTDQQLADDTQRTLRTLRELAASRTTERRNRKERRSYSATDQFLWDLGKDWLELAVLKMVEKRCKLAHYWF